MAERLHPFVVSFLLAGPTARAVGWTGGIDTAPADVRRQVRRIVADRRVGARLWQQHRPFLLAEAERLHIRPRWPGRRFWAEGLAVACEARR